MNKFKMLSSVVIAMTVFAGCAAKEPTKGDFMRMHAADQKEIAENWDKGTALKQSGEKLVKHGEKLIKSGEKDIVTGKEEIEKGNQEIIEGTRLSNESERIFHEKYPELKLEVEPVK